MKLRLLPASAFLCAVALCFPALAQAATLNVPSTAYPTIQSAINAASSGDTVLVADGTYTGPGNVDIDFGGKNLTVTSQHGAASTIINCQGSSNANHRGFYLHSGETNAVISGMTVKNGFTSPIPGGVLSDGYGGGIYIGSGSVTVQGCIITNNSAIKGAGGIYSYTGSPSSKIMLNNCTITNNTDYGDSAGGGGVCNFADDGSITLTSCVVSGNSAQIGGGVSNSTEKASSSITLINCNLSQNTSSDHGGGVSSFINNAGAINITSCTIASNNSILGGGLYSMNELGTGSIAVTASVISGNIALWDGGGVINFGYAGKTTLTNCLLRGNSADVGAGIDNEDGGIGTITVLITNCTLTENVAGYSGGGIEIADYTDCTSITLANNIVYANTGSGDPDDEITYDPTSNSSASPNTTDCDVQGGYPGTGNINADPLFVSAADFHLQPTSPCLGAGTATGAPATTLDGQTRPNPPSIGAYELTPPTHVLWDNTNGTAAIWNYSLTNGTFTLNTFGPYPNWKAVMVADGGTDGLSRVLWDYTNGTASIWSLNNSTGSFTQYSFGPYAGWTAKTLSVGADNTTHVLWTNTNGTASLWNYNTSTGTFTQNSYGPYAGWTATALADGADGQTRLLWDYTNGTASIWSLNNSTGQFTQFSFGPYAGWTAKTLSVGADNTTHVLWNNTSGQAAIWNYSTALGTFTLNTYGPYAGWTATSLANGADGQTRLLWDYTNGTASIWSLDNVTGVFSQFSFGPYGGWNAASVSSD